MARPTSSGSDPVDLRWAQEYVSCEQFLGLQLLVCLIMKITNLLR